MAMSNIWYEKAILVKGFPTEDLDASVQELASYFSDKARSGGDALETNETFPGVKAVTSQKEVIIAFQSIIATNRVLDRNEHTITVKGKQYLLSVTKCLLQFYSKYCLSESGTGKTSSIAQNQEHGDSDSLGTTPTKQRKTEDTRVEFNLELTENDSYTMDHEVDIAQRPVVQSPQSTAIQDSGLPNTGAAAGPDVRPKTTFQRQHSPQRRNDTTIEVDPRKVEVIIVRGRIDPEIVELYFENKRESGGGPIISVECTKDDTAIVEFEYESDAAEVLSSGRHLIANIECRVRPYQIQRVQATENMNTTVIVTGVKNPLTLDVLELWLENDANGGGPIRSINEDQFNHVATVEFEDPKHAEHIIKKNTANVAGLGVNVTFSRPMAFSDDEDEDEKKSIVVTNFRKSSSKDVLKLFFENKKKSGGGELQSIEVDEAKGEAIVTFQTEEVANRVLKKTDLKLQSHNLQVTRRKRYKWDGRSVEVHGVDGSLNADLLTLIFESRKKSGGGPVSNIEIGKKSAIIRFKEHADAQRVLEQGTVNINKQTLTITKPNPETLQESRTHEQFVEKKSTEVLVLGVPQNTTVDLLELLFENKEKSGGGPLKNVTMEEEWGTATLHFEDAKVAQRVADRRELEFNGTVLHLELKAAAQSQPQKYTHYDSPKTEQQPQRSIEVTGIPDNSNEEFLTLLFESEKNSGGAVECLRFDSDTGTAIVTFKDAEVAKRVVEKSKLSGLTMNKSHLTIRMESGQLSAVSMKGSCAIEVKGAPANVTEDMIKMFFENRRRSGGGDIEEMVFLEDSIVITFGSNEVAERVQLQHQRSPLKLENMPLEVKQLKNSHRPKHVHDTIVQQNALFLQDLPETAQLDDVVEYLNRIPKCEVDNVWFGLQKGKAMAHFYLMPDYQRIYQMCCLKPLKGKLIGVQCVEKPKSIEVYNVSKLTKQRLEMYFEHKRSGGGDIQDVDMNLEEDYAIITFLKYGIAESVVNKIKHEMEHVKLTVGLHYECLGILPPSHDRSTPTGSLPDHLVITTIDTEILGFLATTSNRALMDDKLNAVHAQLQWPDGATANPDTVTIQCTLSASNATKRTTETWPDQAKTQFEQVFDLFSKETTNVLQDAWQEFLKRIGQIEQGDDSLRVRVDQDSCTVTTMGKKQAVNQLMDGVLGTKHAVEDEFARKKQVISEPVKNVLVYKIKFLQAYKFPQTIKETYKDAQVTCSVKEKKITLVGLPGEVMNIKLQMYELMNEIQTNTLDMTPAATKLLAQRKVKDHLIKQFRDRDIFMMYDVERPGKVLVCARGTADLTSGTAIMKNAILDTKRTIPHENQETLSTPEWNKFVDGLLRDYDGDLLLKVSDDKSAIEVTCVNEISAGVLEMIQQFLQHNTILEQFVNMDEGTFKFLSRYMKTEFDEIEKTFHCAIQYSRNKKTGITLKGTSESLRLASQKVLAKANNVAVCTHGINKPGMPKYFVSTRGRDYLDSLEHKHQVAIVIGEKQRPGMSVADMLSSVTPLASEKPKVKSKLKLVNGQTIYVARGDLTEYRVDVIVNAANERLAHVGGIAKAIVDKGGPSIQRECDAFVQSRGPLRIGAIFASEAGKLPCKRVVHTVGPRWEGGRRGEINLLYESVWQALKATKRLNLQTVGLPCISGGVYGFDTNVASKTILEAIKEFCEEDKDIKEIHLVDPNNKVVNAFHCEMCKLFGEDNVELEGAVKIEAAKPIASTSTSATYTSMPTASTNPDWTTQVCFGNSR